MTIITCPKCQSSFKFDQSSVGKPRVKMRCSVCSHVFIHIIEKQPTIEEEFDSLIRQNESPAETQEEGLVPSEESSQEIAETDEPPPRKEPGADYESEVQPSSVIREIDSILGKGADIAPEEGLVSKPEKRKKRSSWVFLFIAVLVTLVLAGVWFIRGNLPFFGAAQDEQEQQVIETGPFFSIPEQSITYELLTSPSEGAVLVIKGVIVKLSQKPLQSVMVQARVYDPQNKLIDTRSAFAGIVPHAYEFTRNKRADIDALLNAEPASTGIIASSQELPFAIAFYGRPAREGTSFQVEVKEFQWK
ncbi:MAG TPA: DUF3426 domain-containing protein [Deltaproteobacteria bacterium]|nr:DUF3426 domain-containing protein [Deltaproteobacteria bacterium]